MTSPSTRPSPRLEGLPPRWMQALMLPAMGAAFVVYVVLHSPLRTAIARSVGRPGASTYFTGSWMDLGSTLTGSVIVPGSMMDAGVVFLAITAALVAAAALSTRFDGQGYERPLVFGLLAAGLVIVPATVVGGLASLVGGTFLRPPLGPLLTALPALGIALVLGRSGWRLATWSRPAHWRSLPVTLGLLAVLLLSVSAVVSLAQAPTGFDALAYHAPMAVYLWRDGNLVDLLERAPFGFALAHPGTAEIWFGLLRVGFGERVANLGQLPFSLLGAAATYVFARRLGLRAGAARVGAFAFLLAPMVAVQAGMQLSDVTSAAFMMGAVALLSGPGREWTPWRLACVGLALGLAVTAKVAALPAVAAVVMFVGLMAVRERAHGDERRAKALAVLALAFAVAVGPWWIRNTARFGNPIYPAALPFIGRGVVVGEFAKKDDRFVPSPAAWPLYPALESHSEQSGLGPLFLVGAVPGLAALGWRRRKRLLPYGLVTVFMLPAWWVLTQHEPRHLLPVLGLTFAFVPWALLAVPRRWRWAGAALLIAAGVFSAAVTVDQAFAPRASEPRARAQFYDEIWGIDPAVAGRDEREALLYHTGYASLSYAGDYPLLGPSLERVLFTVDAGQTTAEIVDLMRRHGVEYAYVPVAADAQGAVLAKYPADTFELVHVSIGRAGSRGGTRRQLYRLRPELRTEDPRLVPSEGRE